MGRDDAEQQNKDADRGCAFTCMNGSIREGRNGRTRWHIEDSICAQMLCRGTKQEPQQKRRQQMYSPHGGTCGNASKELLTHNTEYKSRAGVTAENQSGLRILL